MAITLVCGVFLPRTLRAQEHNIPEVTLSPHYKFLIGGHTVTVGVYWCLPAGPDYYSERWIRMEGTDVTNQFTNDSGNWPRPSNCPGPDDLWEHWSATLDLDVVGEGQLSAFAETWAGYAGADDAYFYMPIAHQGVQVQAEAQSAQARPSSSGNTQRFTITNTSEGVATVTFSRTCTGTLTCGAVPADTVLTVGQSIKATITYSVGATVGDTGVIRLSATSRGDAAASASSWTEVTVANAPTPGVALVGSGEVIERGNCLTASAGPDMAYECGDLRVVHALPSVRTMNETRTPALLFNSQHAEPLPLVSANVTLPSGDPLPSSVQATLTINGVQVSQSWSGSAWIAGESRRITMAVDASTWATGAYTYDLEVSRVTGGSPTLFQKVSGILPVVNRRNGPFGAGWWLAGLERIFYPGDGTIFWVSGDGSTRIYRPVATGVWMATSVTRPDTITLDGSFFHRHLPNNLRVRFDASGLHIATINRLNHQTTFGYSSVGGRTVLSTINVPTPSGQAPVSYVFNYNSAGQLTDVQAPGPTGATRATTLTIDASSGRVQQIHDPDTTFVAFGYGDPSHVFRMTTRTDRRSVVTNFSYDAGGRLALHSLDLNPSSHVVQSYSAVETVGLPGTTKGSAQPLDSTFTQIDGPRTDVVDVARFWFNSFGMIARTRDPLGRESHVTYGDPTFPGLATMVRDPVGLITQYAYNARGLDTATNVINPLGTATNATTRYQWDGKWNLPSQVTSPLGVITAFEYDPTTGNKTWERTGPATSPDSNRVTFAYYASTGLPQSITVPGTNAELFTYDGVRGNLTTHQAPSSAITTQYTDAVGRDTLTVVPLDSIHSGWTRMTYDIADQVRKTVTFGPAMNGASADSIVVTSDYDAEGNLTQVSRSRGVAFTGYAPLTSVYQYDAAGRKTLEENPSSTETFDYDLAGHVVQRHTAHGTTQFQYDAAGQLTRRVVPQITYGQTWCGYFFTTDTCVYSFPTVGTSVCINADTAHFSYDANGRISQADNIYSHIQRSYKPNGQLASETQRIRSYYSNGTIPCEADPGGGYTSDFNGHVYTLTYGYNLDGQRTSLAHPGGTQFYAYSGSPSGRGLLTGTTDIGSRNFTFDYDAAGRVRKVHYPGSVTDTRTYGTDGRLSARDVTGVISDAFGYDPQDRVTTAYNQYQNGVSVGLTATTRYSGLGAVVASNPLGIGWDEAFTVDGLGNRLRHQQQGLRPEWHADYLGIRFFSYGADGTLASVVDSLLPGNDPYVFEQYYQYDNAGNTSLTFLRETDSYSEFPTLFDASKSYYGADEKLRVTNRHVGLGQIGDSRQGHRSVFEEYRYDALGRRVLVRARHESACPVSTVPIECASYLERIVWDGDQVLLEKRTNGAEGLSGTSLDQEAASGSAYGQVTYTHAGGLDQPLSVIKDGVAVMPHANWRGQYEVGTLQSGASTAPCTGGWNCPIVAFQGAGTIDGQPVNPGTDVQWWGNLLTGKADASGLQYMRNRYYDPKSGRFTQADPIGLAGGLNSYGFASGDPVNFSDPLGLFPCCIEGGAMLTAVNLATPPWDRKEYQDKIRDMAIGWNPGALATVAENRAMGLAAEGFLARLFGGGSVGKMTSIGMRYLDNLTADGVARESKVGRTFLTSRIRSQILKDVELMHTPGSGVKSVEWHFTRGLTGIGPSQPLREALTNAGIKIVENK